METRPFFLSLSHSRFHSSRRFASTDSTWIRPDKDDLPPCIAGKEQRDIAESCRLSSSPNSIPPNCKTCEARNTSTVDTIILTYTLRAIPIRSFARYKPRTIATTISPRLGCPASLAVAPSIAPTACGSKVAPHFSPATQDRRGQSHPSPVPCRDLPPYLAASQASNSLETSSSLLFSLPFCIPLAGFGLGLHWQVASKLAILQHAARYTP